MKSIRLGLAALLLAAAVPLTALAETLTIGAYPSNPPWEFINEKSEFEGFEVEIAREVAKRLSMDVQFENLGFQALFAATASGRIDGAISSISITPERLESQSFTQPYYDSDGAVMVKEGAGLSKPEDLAGKTLGAVAATTGAKWIEENKDKYGIADFTSYAAQQDLLLDTANGRVDGAVSEIAGLLFAMKQTPGFEIAMRLPTGETFAMMMTKDHPKLAEINQVISDMKTDGTMAAIHETWFGVAPDAGTSTVEPRDVPTN